MAFHVFLQKKVDAVILEVGMGGQYDATNVIKDPVVCGISSLGLDHTDVLGDTIDKIAWHKAGIIKVLYIDNILEECTSYHCSSARTGNGGNS